MTPDPDPGPDAVPDSGADPDHGGRIDHVAAVARAGADVAHEAFAAGVDPETKDGATRVVDPGDVVTSADRDAQDACLSAIRERYPDDAVVAEEGDARKRLPTDAAGDDPAWVVDPVDGTYNFVRGLPAWATAVALVVDGTTRAAATVAPALGETYLVEGEDVGRNGRPLSVSDRDAPETAAVAYAVVPPFGDRAAYAGGVAEMVERFGETRRVGSLQVLLARVAAGAIEGAATPRPVNPWDALGGVRMVRAAGGVVTDRHGDPWHPDATGLVASNGAVHGDLLDVVGRMTDGH